MKTAKTIDEQIEILRSHGIIVKDECKAKEILHDIGYYRLGFYFFPFDILAKENLLYWTNVHTFAFGIV